MPETYYQRIARKQREAQEARAARMKEAERNKRRRNSKPKSQPTEDNTPFGQGDNLGESPDY